MLMLHAFDRRQLLSVPVQEFSESQASDIVGDRVLGARLHPGLTISENSAEVFCTRFSPEGK